MLRRRLHLARSRREDGFTLIELLFAMMLLGVAVTALTSLLATTANTSNRTQQLDVLQTQVRAVVTELAADLRQAQCNGTTSPVTTATGTQLTFTSPDRMTPYHLRQISYQLVNGQLQRAFATSTNTGGPPWTIPALGTWVTQLGPQIVNASAFTYEDANGNPTTNPASVASVFVSLTVQPTIAPSGASATYSTNVDLRTPTC